MHKIKENLYKTIVEHNDCNCIFIIPSTAATAVVVVATTSGKCETVFCASL